MIGQVSIRTRACRTGATTGDRRRWRSLEKAINAGARNAPRGARPAPGHKNETWKVRPSGSSSRPPSGQRAFGLNGGDLGGQQFVVHGDLAHLGLQRFHPRDRRARVPSGLTPRRPALDPAIRSAWPQRHSLPGRRHPTVRHATNTPPPPSCVGRNSASVLHRRQGGARASYGGAFLNRPLGLQPCINRHFRNLRLRFNYRSQMSQLTVTHPT